MPCPDGELVATTLALMNCVNIASAIRVRGLSIWEKPTKSVPQLRYDRKSQEPHYRLGASSSQPSGASSVRLVPASGVRGRCLSQTPHLQLSPNTRLKIVSTCLK